MGLRSCALLGASCQSLEFCAPPRLLGDDEVPCLQTHTCARARVVVILISCHGVADQPVARHAPGALLTSISFHYPCSSLKNPQIGLTLLSV